MGYQIIRQPDGKLCVWSTYVDSIVITDATPSELVEHFAEEAAEESRRQTRRVLEHVMDGASQKVYYQFAMTYDEAVAASRQPPP